MSVRVIRVLEYVYDDAEAAMRDQEGWFVPPMGTKAPNKWSSITSAVVPMRKHEEAVPLPSFSATDRERLLADVRRDMAGAARSLLGSGYVPDYYESCAADFVAIAEHALDGVLRGPVAVPE